MTLKAILALCFLFLVVLWAAWRHPMTTTEEDPEGPPRDDIMNRGNHGMWSGGPGDGGMDGGGSG